MTTTEHRPSSVLDRPRRADEDRVPAARTEAISRGWGSQAERRLMRQVLVFFALLGLYVSAFVLVGTVVWT